MDQVTDQVTVQVNSFMSAFKFVFMLLCLHFVCGLFSNLKFYVMSAVLATLIGAGLGLFGAHQATKDQNAYNKMLYDEYKDPVSQARRLRAAGLNPAFALSNIAQGALQTPDQTSPQDTSGLQALSSSLPNAVLQDQQAELAKQQAKNQEIRNGFENTKQLLDISQMVQNIKGLKFDNYVKDGSKDLQISILKQQEQQMYTKTYTDNLLAVGSEWDVATKAMYAKQGQPLEFQKMRFDIAQTAANIAYQLKVNKWYDKFSKAQIDSLYDNAAAALINAYANQRNSFTNQYLAPAQRNMFNQQAGNYYQTGLSTQWNRRKDKALFPLTKQALKLGVQSQQFGVKDQVFEYNFKTSRPGRIFTGLDRGIGAVSPFRFGFGQ